MPRAAYQCKAERFKVPLATLATLLSKLPADARALCDGRIRYRQTWAALGKAHQCSARKARAMFRGAMLELVRFHKWEKGAKPPALAAKAPAEHQTAFA